MTRPYDAVIVGAGLSGLYAADLLQAASKRVLVLEATERVGGRTLASPFAGQTIDLGAQWVGPSQRRILQLARRLNVRKARQYAGGAALWESGGRRGSSRWPGPNIPVRELLKLTAVTLRLAWLARRVPARAPWQAKNAAEWDRLSVEDFLRQHAGEGLACDLLRASMRVMFAVEPRDVSLLQCLFAIRAGGGLRRSLTVHGGAQQWYFPEGAGLIASRLASTLPVKLSEAVQAIDCGASQIEVHTERDRYLCKHVIVALAPVLVQRIEFRPELPAPRRQLVQTTSMGAVIKCFVRYERAFWREAGLSGEAVSDGTVGLCMDGGASPQGGGILVAFVLGDQARRFSSRPGQRKQAVLEALARLFGADALRPCAYEDHDWCKDPHSRGCYAAIFDFGALTACGSALLEPVGAVHWAGAQTATEHGGHMEGALQAGERAAREVLRAL